MKVFGHEFTVTDPTGVAIALPSQRRHGVKVGGQDGHRRGRQSDGNGLPNSVGSVALFQKDNKALVVAGVVPNRDLHGGRALMRQNLHVRNTNGVGEGPRQKGRRPLALPKRGWRPVGDPKGTVLVDRVACLILGLPRGNGLLRSLAEDVFHDGGGMVFVVGCGAHSLSALLLMSIIFFFFFFCLGTRDSSTLVSHAICVRTLRGCVR